MTTSESSPRSIDDERVRDHLANERTYLAWLRTGVSTLGLGVVLAKLRYILGPAYPQSSGVVHAANIGLLLAFIGLTTIVMAVTFFLKTRNQIRARKYSPDVRYAVALAVVMVSLGLIIIWYLMQPTS